MKIALTFLLFGLYCSVGYSQQDNKKDLVEFIKSKGNFVFLKGSNDLPSIINEYMPEIKNILRIRNIKFKNALVLIDNIKVDSAKIQIPVFDLNGFKKQFKNKDQKSEDGFHIMIMGNASGKDGIIIIDRTNKYKTQFLMYE